jgi:hypothetical protein
VGVALAGCDDPQEPVTQDSGSTATYDSQRQTLEFRIESTSGELSRLRLVASDVRFDPETRNVHAKVSIRNDGNEPVLGPPAIRVFGFVPADVVPVNGICGLDPNSSDPTATNCFYDHSGTYGEDDLLSPNETSEPIEWILHDPSGESFAFRARIMSHLARAEIAGVVWDDRNGNGLRENDEPGIAGATLLLQFGEEARSTVTNARGAYAFGVDQPGHYRVDKQPQAGWRITTPHPYEVVLVEQEDGTLSSFRDAHFGCQRVGLPDGVPVLGVVYEDLNRNGIRERGEPGIPRIEVHGATPNCPTFAPIVAVTGRDGVYEMRLPDCIPPFEVMVPRLRCYVFTSPNPIVFMDPPTPGDVLRADFGLARPDTSRGMQEAGVIRNLAEAYATRNAKRFTSLLADDPASGAEFLFLLAEPTQAGETMWGFAEETRIHRRMFDPENIPAGDPPVPPQFWVQAINITLTQLGEFRERPDLYRSATNTVGLDPRRWRASDARYATNVFWTMQGDVDFQVEGEANFVVIEDLMKPGCDEDRYWLYIWEELPPTPLAAAEQASWSAVKTLYR